MGNSCSPKTVLTTKWGGEEHSGSQGVPVRKIIKQQSALYSDPELQIERHFSIRK